MVFDATTLAKVHLLLHVETGDTSIDTEISELITAVSLRAERYIGRSFEITERTEVFDIGRHTRAVFLTHWPVDTAQTFEVRNHIRRDFTVDALDSDLYAISSRTGRLYFETRLVTGPDVLQVIYTGGLAANATALQAIEDLEYAIRRQVAYEYQRRNTPGGKQSRFSRGKGAGAQAEGEVDWLIVTKRVLDSYRGNFLTMRGATT